MPGGITRIYHFVRTIPFLKPRLLSLVANDWVTGLAMSDYVRRNFHQEMERETGMAQRYLERFRQACHLDLRNGSVEISLQQVKNTASNLSIAMKGLLDQDFFLSAARHTRTVLKNTSCSVTIRPEDIDWASASISMTRSTSMSGSSGRRTRVGCAST